MAEKYDASLINYGDGPSEAEWALEDELLNTGAKGWNYLQKLPEVLKKRIPWLRDKELAFVAEDDMEEFSFYGWRPMRTEHFGSKGLNNFNKVIGFRFNLSDVDGVVRYKKQILCMMPTDVRKRQMQRRHDSFENYYAKVTNERQPYVHPLDARGAELNVDAENEREEGVIVHDDKMPEGQVRREEVPVAKDD